ncbi:hypothetical protein GCM10009078_04920 [Cupriavidus gilardii]
MIGFAGHSLARASAGASDMVEMAENSKVAAVAVRSEIFMATLPCLSVIDVVWRDVRERRRVVACGFGNGDCRIGKREGEAPTARRLHARPPRRHQAVAARQNASASGRIGARGR